MRAAGMQTSFSANELLDPNHDKRSTSRNFAADKQRNSIGSLHQASKSVAETAQMNQMRKMICSTMQIAYDKAIKKVDPSNSG